MLLKQIASESWAPLAERDAPGRADAEEQDKSGRSLSSMLTVRRRMSQDISEAGWTVMEGVEGAGKPPSATACNRALHRAWQIIVSLHRQLQPCTSPSLASHSRYVSV
eukprot:scaffold220784_cov32-Tisochrysis_lutea.AAC.1